MAIWDPFEEIRKLEEEIDSIFSEFWRTGGRLALPSRMKSIGKGKTIPREELLTRAPAVDVIEREKEIVVKADLPAVEKKNVKVKVNPESVSIYGEIKKEKKEENETYRREERMYGRFSRLIPLPVEIDPQKAEAKFENGVLEITLPKVKVGKRAKEISFE